LKDYELGEELVQKFDQDFENSENPYEDAGRGDSHTSIGGRLANSKCDLAWNLEEKKEVTFTSPAYGRPNTTYPSGYTCHISFTVS